MPSSEDSKCKEEYKDGLQRLERRVVSRDSRSRG